MKRILAILVCGISLIAEHQSSGDTSKKLDINYLNDCYKITKNETINIIKKLETKINELKSIEENEIKTFKKQIFIIYKSAENDEIIYKDASNSREYKLLKYKINQIKNLDVDKINEDIIFDINNLINNIKNKYGNERLTNGPGFFIKPDNESIKLKQINNKNNIKNTQILYSVTIKILNELLKYDELRITTSFDLDKNKIENINELLKIDEYFKKYEKLYNIKNNINYLNNYINSSNLLENSNINYIEKLNKYNEIIKNLNNILIINDECSFNLKINEYKNLFIKNINKIITTNINTNFDNFQIKKIDFNNIEDNKISSLKLNTINEINQIQFYINKTKIDLDFLNKNNYILNDENKILLNKLSNINNKLYMLLINNNNIIKSIETENNIKNIEIKQISFENLKQIEINIKQNNIEQLNSLKLKLIKDKESYKLENYINIKNLNDILEFKNTDDVIYKISTIEKINQINKYNNKINEYSIKLSKLINDIELQINSKKEQIKITELKKSELQANSNSESSKTYSFERIKIGDSIDNIKQKLQNFHIYKKIYKTESNDFEFFEYKDNIDSLNIVVLIRTNKNISNSILISFINPSRNIEEFEKLREKYRKLKFEEMPEGKIWNKLTKHFGTNFKENKKIEGTNMENSVMKVQRTWNMSRGTLSFNLWINDIIPMIFIKIE